MEMCKVQRTRNAELQDRCSCPQKICLTGNLFPRTEREKELGLASEKVRYAYNYKLKCRCSSFCSKSMESYSEIIWILQPQSTWCPPHTYILQLTAMHSPFLARHCCHVMNWLMHLCHRMVTIASPFHKGGHTTGRTKDRLVWACNTHSSNAVKCCSSAHKMVPQRLQRE